MTHRAARAARTAPLPARPARGAHRGPEAGRASPSCSRTSGASGTCSARVGTSSSRPAPPAASRCRSRDRRSKRTPAIPRARALFLYPTKALAQDQARKLAALRLRGVVAALYDGDTPQAQRSRIRATATILLSNPDMLHVGILPAHERWAEFLHHLRYVVLDEAHVYRGVFGSHVAQVVRRLRRLCAAYGSSPQFVLASATIANPTPFAERLVGLPFTAVDENGAPQPEQHDRAVEPAVDRCRPGRAQECPGRIELRTGRDRSWPASARSASPPAARPLSSSTATSSDGCRTATRRRATGCCPTAPATPREQRRDIERRLFDGELRAVVATSALELGIDVGESRRRPGHRVPRHDDEPVAALGPGRPYARGWAVLVAGQDALDQYFMREPERLLSREVEEAIVDLTNPHILRGPPLCCRLRAAAERAR